MKSPANIFKGILAFVVIIAIGVAIGWLASSRHKHSGQSPATMFETALKFEEKTNPASVGGHSTAGGENLFSTDAEAPEQATTNWEDMVSDIIADDTDITNKVVEMVALYPKLSDAGKLEVAEHLNNLVPDDDFAPLSNILTSADVPPKVASFVLGELLNRPKEIMMPLTLAVACNPQNPANHEAKDTLETFFDESYGDDCAKWKAAMDKWLIDNPN